MEANVVKEVNIEFQDRAFDAFLLRWMRGELSPAELREWSQILTYNREFREELSDFLKSFREPSWNRRRDS